MELSSEQTEIAQDWFNAYQIQKSTWENFSKTPAGLQYEEARIFHKKYNTPKTSLLQDKALDNALKTKEFNNFCYATSLEIDLRKKFVTIDAQEKMKQ